MAALGCCGSAGGSQLGLGPKLPGAHAPKATMRCRVSVQINLPIPRVNTRPSTRVAFGASLDRLAARRFGVP